MMTKEEERKALAAIEAILNKCDPDGYVAAAFSGCVADAQNNIDNDFMCSYRGRYISAEDRRAEAACDLVKVRAELAKEKKDFSDYRESVAREAAAWKKAADDARADANNAAERADAAEAANLHLKDEVIRLKARLFDMMEALDR